MSAPPPKTDSQTGRPTQTEAEQADRTLLRWAGDDPTREGLLDTPARVARAYTDFFSGYEIDPASQLRRTFAEGAGCDDIVLRREVRFASP